MLKGTPQAAHTDFQRARKGVADLNELALVAMQASRNLREQEPGIDTLVFHTAERRI